MQSGCHVPSIRVFDFQISQLQADIDACKCRLILCAGGLVLHGCVARSHMRGIAGLLCFAAGNFKFELTASLERSRKWFASPVQLVLWQASVSDSGDIMGCCGSKAVEEADDPLTGSGICQKQLYPPHISPTGLQVQPAV